MNVSILQINKRNRLTVTLACLLMFQVCALAQLPTPTYGWNLGNTLEPPSGEGTWGPAATQNLINAVADSGFNTIRLPVAWDSHANPSTHQIDPAWMARVKQVVDWCYAKNLTVIVNCHWDGGWLENNITNTVNPTIDAKMQSYWTQIANTFKNYDNHLLFAGANEPNCDTAAEWTTLRSYYNTFISAVRATGGNNTSRWLVIQGPNTNIDLTYDLVTTLPADSASGRLVVQIHHYPYQWTIMTEDATWGKMFYFWGQGYHSPTMLDRNSTWGEEAYTDDQFQKMATKFVSKGVPVIIGEWGAVKRTGYSDLTGTELDRHLASRTYFSKTITDKANSLGLKPIWWDAGGTGRNSMWLFDRSTAAVIDQDNVRALTGGAALPPPGVATMPTVTTQPADVTVTAGQSASFTVVVTGTAPFTYQWRKGTTNIAGATTATFAIAATATSDAGSYSVVIANAAGTVTSASAILIVQSAPVITSPPTGETVAPNRSAAFTVSASSTPAPDSYQWQYLAAGSGAWIDLSDGNGYSGVTTATLVISNPASGMNGDKFRAIITNSIGSTTSTPATLTVAVPATWARGVLLMNGTSVSSTAPLENLDPAWRLTGSGDFNGDGKVDILLQNGVTGQHSIWLMNGITHSLTIDLGNTDPTWQTAGTGDFNSDGKPDILWQNTATGQHSIWLMNGTTNIGNIELPTTDPIWRMTGTGDFNQDGQTDILWQNIITGQHSIWLMSLTTNIGNIELGTTDPTWLIAGTGDFNGDGRTDILWQNTITGQMSLWLMNGTTVIGASDFGAADPSWQAAGVGDFDSDGKVDVLRQKKIDVRNDLNGDGFTDILWQNTVTGQHSIWLMNGTTYLGGYELGTTDVAWQIAGTGDFNADGQTDILWHNLTTGQHSVWLMHGTTYIGGVELETTDPKWQIGGTGEFNGDGLTDILCQNVVTGEHSVWLMNGTTHTSTVSLGTTEPAWQMVGSDDFNADGHTDVLWQNVATGEHSLWLMTGTVHTGTVGLGTTSPSWEMAGTGDFNADGSIDILWQNTVTGQHSIWLMHGTTSIGNIELGATSPAWIIAN